jgi:hypothetical protein
MQKVRANELHEQRTPVRPSRAYIAPVMLDAYPEHRREMVFRRERDDLRRRDAEIADLHRRLARLEAEAGS